MSKEKEYAEHHFIDGEYVRDMLFGSQYVDGTIPHTFIQTAGEGSIVGAQEEDIEQIVQIAANPSPTVPAYRIANASLLLDDNGSLSGTSSAEDADFLMLDIQVVVDMKQREAFSVALEESVTKVLSTQEETEAEELDKETEEVLEVLSKLKMQQWEFEKRLEALDKKRQQQ